MADTLAQAATHPSLSCENYKTRLRLWPEGRGGVFVCDGRCRGGDKILNTGKNRSLHTFYSAFFIFRSSPGTTVSSVILTCVRPVLVEKLRNSKGKLQAHTL